MIFSWLNRAAHLSSCTTVITVRSSAIMNLWCIWLVVISIFTWIPFLKTIDIRSNIEGLIVVCNNGDGYLSSMGIQDGCVIWSSLIVNTQIFSHCLRFYFVDNGAAAGLARTEVDFHVWTIRIKLCSLLPRDNVWPAWCKDRHTYLFFSISSLCDPCSIIFPCSIMRILLAFFTVLKRW